MNKNIGAYASSIKASVEDATKAKEHLEQVMLAAATAMDNLRFGDDLAIRVSGQGLGHWLRTITTDAEEYIRACQGHIDAILTAQANSEVVDVCIAGAPAINGRCGDEECVCAPAKPAGCDPALTVMLRSESLPALNGMKIIARTDKGVYLRIPPELQKPCAGGCECDDCKKSGKPGMWDTLLIAVEAPKDSPWDFASTVHMPNPKQFIDTYNKGKR